MRSKNHLFQVRVSQKGGIDPSCSGLGSHTQLVETVSLSVDGTKSNFQLCSGQNAFTVFSNEKLSENSMRMGSCFLVDFLDFLFTMGFLVKNIQKESHSKK